jgi:uncharacterized protein YndB with AHSA1/START domain
MTKQPFQVEYIFDKVSKESLWSRIATIHGLAEWFADEVKEDGGVYSFYWNNHQMTAQLVSITPLQSIRFHWEEEEEGSYFQLRIHSVELTGGLALEITDFAEPEEIKQSITLWNTEIKLLKHKLGILS